MIQYQRRGEDFLLVANTLHGVQRLAIGDLGKYDAVTEEGGNDAQIPVQRVPDLKGAVRMDNYDTNHALILFDQKYRFDLRVVLLP
ncbi:MAG: hypothetical protein ABI811_03100 [Acidobacteriota bacterium]